MSPAPARRWTSADMDTIFSDAPPLSSVLPWRWVEEDRIHVLADGSLGVAWRVPLADVELLDETGRAPVSLAFEGLLNRLPPGTAFQVLLLSRPGLGEALAHWRTLASTPAHPFVTQAAVARDQTLTRGAQGFFGEYRARQTTAVITVRCWPATTQLSRLRRLWSHAATWVGSLGTGAPTLQIAQRAWQETTAALGRIADTVETQCRLAGMPAEPLGGQAFLDLVWVLLNPGTAASPPVWDPIRALSEQATGSYVTLRREGLTLGGLEGRVLSLKALPPQTWPGMLTLPAVAGGTGGCLDVPGTCLISVSGSVLDQERATGQLKWKKMMAWRQRTTLFGDTSVEAGQMRDELDRLLQKAFAAGTRVSQAAFHLVCLDEPDRISRTVETALGALGQLECQAMVERLVAGPCWLESLPFGYDPAHERGLCRARRLLVDTLADLLPLYGGFTGTPRPAQLFLNRRGEAVAFHPFDADTAPHVIVTGVTGAGKSFQTADLILQHLRLGADLFVLDKGNSYRRLCTLVGGQYLAISPNTPVTINPCAGDGSKEHHAFLTLVLAEMASGGDKRFELDREQIGVLAQAVAHTFTHAPAGREVLLRDIVRTLADDPDPDRIGPKLARRLYPFTTEGPYGHFFDGPNQFTTGRGLTVVELGELSSYPDLQATMTMVLMHANAGFLQARPKDHPAFMITDEAWNLLQSENAAKVLETAVRTYRKLGCAAVFISQYLTDFEGPAGRAIRENCPHRLFLRQEPEALTRVKELIGLTPHQEALLRTVGSVRGAFSEGLLVTPSGSALVRLVVDPLTYWTATTSPQDVARLETAQRQGNGDLGQAILALTNGGVARAPAEQEVLTDATH